MTAKELRIGNLVYKMELNVCVCKYEFTILPIDCCMLFDLSNNNKVTIEPIELNEELFIRLGFSKINHINGYSFYSLSNSKENKCHIDIYNNKTEFQGNLIKHCKYVHELQNLYFALTREELKYKL